VKMVKQFTMCNSSPATAVKMLHTMGGRLYDRQMVSNIFNTANAVLLEEMGVDTTAMKAQQLVDYILYNTIVNGVIILRPNKAHEHNLVVLVKMVNEEIRVEWVDHNYVFSAEDFDEAHWCSLPS
jgi:hypothetical protein